VTVLFSTAPPAGWNLSTGQGSAAQYAFTLTTLAGGPYPVAGATWEYVIRPVSGLGSSLLALTTVPSSAGGLAVIAETGLSQVVLTLNPAATAQLATGSYSHALWMNPSTVSAFLWLTGSLQVNLVPQP
jgi:hypothetical protein